MYLYAIYSFLLSVGKNILGWNTTKKRFYKSKTSIALVIWSAGGKSHLKLRSYFEMNDYFFALELSLPWVSVTTTWCSQNRAKTLLVIKSRCAYLLSIRLL